MGLTQLVRELPQLPQGVRPLAEHFPGRGTDSVHNKVAVNMGRIDVGGDQHLTLRPCLSSKGFGELMGLLSSDPLLRGEGLGVVVKPYGAFLAVHLPCGDKLLQGQLRCAVLPADELLSRLSQRLFLLLHIAQDAAESSL